MLQEIYGGVVVGFIKTACLLKNINDITESTNMNSQMLFCP